MVAYFNGGIHGYNSARGFVHPEPCTDVYCDTCAETAIPLPEFGPDGRTGSRHRETGFKWAPFYGGERKCDQCGTAV